MEPYCYTRHSCHSSNGYDPYREPDFGENSGIKLFGFGRFTKIAIPIIISVIVGH